ncbi:pyridoxal-phosphate dependent enzyme [Streptomyces sp. NPDC003007]
MEDGDEPLIAEGAGTIAVELAPLGLDALLVPVGNGALISGIGCWTKARSPRTRIIGVCAAGAPAMATSWRTGVSEATGPVSTMADGIAVRVPMPAAVGWIREVVDDVLLVDEEDIRAGPADRAGHPGVVPGALGRGRDHRGSAARPGRRLAGNGPHRRQLLARAPGRTRPGSVTGGRPGLARR